MDPEQIRHEMRLTRASIDRKLNALSIRAAAARQDAVRRALAGGLVTAAAFLFVWWWRR